MLEGIGRSQRTWWDLDTRAWLWVASVFTFLAITAASYWMAGPIIHADEGGYLLDAATIAGRVRTSVIWGSNYSGYGLLLTPAWLLFSNPSNIYHAVLVINALLIASAPFALFNLLSSLRPDSKPGVRLLASLAGAWHTPLLAMSMLAFSENALIPCYLWFLAFIARAAKSLEKAPAVYAGALGGFLFLVHPRGLLLALPVIAVIVIACRRRSDVVWILCLLASALAVTCLHWPLEHLAGKHGSANTAGYNPASLVHAAFDPANWRRMVVDLVGISNYALVSSAGLALLAMNIGIGRRHQEGGRETALILGMGAALIACTIVAAVYVVHGRRIDYLIHGRYVVPALIPLIAFGMLTFPSARRATLLLAAFGVLLWVALLGLLFNHVVLPPATPWMPENVIGLYLPFRLAHGVHWTAMGLYFVAFFSLLMFFRRYSPHLPAAFFAFANLALAGLFVCSQFFPQSQARENARVLVHAVERVEVDQGHLLCLTISPEIDHWHLVDYRFWLYREIPQSAMHDPERCGRAVISPLSTMASRPGWILADTTPDHLTGLFVHSAPGKAIATR